MWNTVAICDHCKPKYVIWENVKNVLSKKNIHNFEKYLDRMESIGYKNYHKVLNAKWFGVPQNRERIFVISIRKDLEQWFEFPKGYDNGIRLKDVLEQEVDDKYFISDEKTQQLILNCKGNLDLSKQVVGTCHPKNDLSFATRDRVYSEENNAPTLSATMYKDAPKVVRACLTPDRVNKRQNGRRFKEDGEPMFTLTSQDRHGILQIGMLDIPGNEQVRRVYDIDGLSPCLNTMQGGNRQPKIIERQEDV
ncbi:DNA cytosine methyltransferase [Clostridium botulinum]|nr:DNA cytosine methyltransferase [Clostridium botulinum]